MSDWGKGAKNNDIGWGQGAVNNDISWGSVHANSWAGDTDIVGLDPAQAIINAFKTRVLADGGTFEAEQCLKDSLPALIENEPSLCVTPNAIEAGKLFSIIPTNGAGDLDVVRATTATYVDADGLIQTALANIPRLDYTNGSCPSILVEPQRTNLVFPSATATTQTRTVTATAHTLSFYGTGTVTLSGVATGTLNGTGANNRVTLTFTPTAGSLILTVIGSVTNWQLEAGSNATSLIQTVSTSVTRNADVISKTGISSLIGQSQGSLVYYFIKNSSNSIPNISLSNNGTNPRFFPFESGTSYVFFLQSATVLVNYLYPLNNFIIGLNKIGITYGAGSFKIYINGSVITSVPYTEQNLSFSKLNIGSAVTDVVGNTSNNNLVLINKEILSESEMIQLTTL